MGQYLPILVILVLGLGFAVSSLLIGQLLSPKRPSAAKSAPYECGIVPRQESPDRFPVKFYLVAMIFIVIDIEIIFLYPYAVTYQGLGVFGLLAILLFAVALFAPFVYLIANGSLDWGPLQSARKLTTAVSTERTTRTTVRRVAGEGRPAEESEVAA